MMRFISFKKDKHNKNDIRIETMEHKNCTHTPPKWCCLSGKYKKSRENCVLGSKINIWSIYHAYLSPRPK